MTRNTFEWCNDGIEPMIHLLQNLSKSDYQYDQIIRAGVYISNDIRELPQVEFEILDVQGIKSIVIIPMFYLDRALGYVGFDDCIRHRVWSSYELELLNSTADVLASLLVRREREEEARRSYQVLQTVSDHIDSLIYANAIDTYELLFVNKGLSKAFGKPPEEMLGQPCWKVLQTGQSGPCPWCPIPRLKKHQALDVPYTWEFQNTVNKHWYVARDTMVPWVDGRIAHIETATEITYKKQYEEELEYFASTDSLTGAYNREWGYRQMNEMLDSMENEDFSLCFIDLDGLKATNDRLGHEAGDDMIRSTVATICKNTRKTDRLFRWGGDEFILLLQCSAENAEAVVQHIQEDLENVNATSRKPFLLSFSYGIVEFRLQEGFKTLEDLIKCADQKMYDNKVKKAKQRSS